MMSEPLDWIEDELEQLRSQALLRRRRVVTSLGNGLCRLPTGARELLDFSSNDYLNLAMSKQLRSAAAEVLNSHGVGARASALVSGTHDLHQQLCDNIAAFEGTESALLFPSGYAANVGTVVALVDEGDVVFCDRLNHASLIDGCRLSGARFRVFSHSDLQTLERELSKVGETQRRLIVTDGLFSMDGDLAPLRELWELAQTHNAMLLVDEAHATGVFGTHGGGTVEHFGLEDQPIVRVGTLSKAIGCLGGFVAGSHVLTEYLFNKARTQIYSTGLPAVLCAAAIAAFDSIRDEPEKRTELLQKSEHLRSLLRERDLNIPDGSIGPIVPVILDDPAKAVAVSEKLQERGFLVPAIRPPTVPAGTSRLRISLSVAHSNAQIERLVSTLAEVV